MVWPRSAAPPCPCVAALAFSYVCPLRTGHVASRPSRSVISHLSFLSPLVSPHRCSLLRPPPPSISLPRSSFDRGNSNILVERIYKAWACATQGFRPARHPLVARCRAPQVLRLQPASPRLPTHRGPPRAPTQIVWLPRVPAKAGTRSA